MDPKLTLIRRYLDAIENDDDETLASCLHPALVQNEHPNRLIPQGARRDRAAVLAGALKGRLVVEAQRYVIVSAMIDGDRLALELEWTARARAPIPSLGKMPGELLRAKFAIFVTLRAGQIVTQENYDCFLP